MMNNIANSKDMAMKTKMTEMSTMANQDASKFEAMENEWNSFKTAWDESTNQFSEWNAKVVKGEVTPEDAVKGIADFKTKMSDAQAKIDSWSNSYAETKSTCEKNMAMAESMNSSMDHSGKK